MPIYLLPFLEALYVMPHELWFFQEGAANYSSVILSLDQALFLLLKSIGGYEIFVEYWFFNWQS